MIYLIRIVLLPSMPQTVAKATELLDLFQNGLMRTHLSHNQERFYLYLILSIGGGVLLCLILLVARLLIQRHRARRDAKFHATNIAENTIPNGFADDISEVDADIDLTTPLPIPSVTIHSPKPVGSIAEVVRYPHVHSHTLRRGAPENEVPRSLNSGSNTLYYYG